MRLYLDDDSVRRMLIRLLRQAGHDIECPTDVGMAGRSDPAHLEHCIRSRRVLLSYNHDDFEQLHELIGAAGGEHSGIFIVRSDNDRRRDMTPRGIISAIGKLDAAKAPIENQFIILNQWR